jgi:hypothetical protein
MSNAASGLCIPRHGRLHEIFLKVAKLFFLGALLDVACASTRDAGAALDRRVPLHAV